MNIAQVCVYDWNPTILMLAASYDFKVVTKQYMLENATMIFGATGNHCLSIHDLLQWKSAKEGALHVLASCPSADDEWDLSGLPEQHPTHEFGEKHPIYDFGTGPRICLLQGGNAVNFVYRAILGEYIRSVQAGILLCGTKLQIQTLANKPAQTSAPGSATAMSDVKDEKKDNNLGSQSGTAIGSTSSAGAAASNGLVTPTSLKHELLVRARSLSRTAMFY